MLAHVPHRCKHFTQDIHFFGIYTYGTFIYIYIRRNKTLIIQQRSYLCGTDLPDGKILKDHIIHFIVNFLSQDFR